jgi:predicted transcriptional regulator
MDPADDNIGKTIRDQREALGLPIEGLAYLAGVSYKTLERIEAGLAKPHRATLTVIERALELEQERTAA